LRGELWQIKDYVKHACMIKIVLSPGDFRL
jgi:hypothetical protein